MALRPHIVHIVGHTEADHAATADDVIEASGIARRSIANALGAPDLTADPLIQRRREELAAETRLTLQAIRDLASPDVEDPWSDPPTLAKAVTSGLLDAPQLKNNPFARGIIQTRIIEGMCLAVDEGGKPLTERARVLALKKENT